MYRAMHTSRNLIITFVLLISSLGNISYVSGLEDCGPPPQGLNTFMTFSNSSLGTLVGQQAVYRCVSGHFYDWGETVIQCNETAKWEVISGPDENATDHWFDCSSRSTYQGCMEINSTLLRSASPSPVFVETSSYERNNRRQCQEYCRDQGLPFAARQGSTCTCMTTISMASTKEDVLCTDSCADLTSFCGTQDLSLYTVFGSVEECVTMTSQLNATETSIPTQAICQEFCRGQDSILSFYRGGLQYCDCLDKVPDVEEVSKRDCVAAESEEEPQETSTSTGRLVITETLDPVTATSCNDLFSQGIFVHGYYYLNDGTKTFCSFYDDSTECDRGWLAYSGNCYRFLSEQASAEIQFQTCGMSGSVLVSVSDQAEWDFLTLAHSSLEYMEAAAVYIGLYDTQKTFSYMWTDETPVILRKFHTGYPVYVDNRCVVLVGGAMQNVLCSDQYGAVCEKSPAIVGCVAVEPIGEPELTSPQLTIPLCFETCRALSKIYSLTRNNTCYCQNDTLAWAGSPVEWSTCNQRCPGNDFQICGANDTSHYFITEDVGQPYRQDCRDMVLGSVLAMAKIQNYSTGEVKVVDCNAVAGGKARTYPAVILRPNIRSCAESWLEISGRCYRFFPEGATWPSGMCNSIGGYTAVYETLQEAENVQQTILSTPTLSAVDKWLFGLFRHRPTGSKVRTSNGAFLDLNMQTSLANYENNFCFAHRSVDVSDISAVVCGSTPYICETGTDYLGCYANPPQSTRVVILYRDNTILQCKELCKGKGLFTLTLACSLQSSGRETNSQIQVNVNSLPPTTPTIARSMQQCCRSQGTTYMAVAGSLACYCVEESDLTKAESEVKCTKTCAVGQKCGADSYTSVYRMDYNQTADSCEELYQQGVLLSGRYLLSGGLTWCGMRDSVYLKSQLQQCDAEDETCAIKFIKPTFTWLGTGSLDLAVDTKYWTAAAAIPTRCDEVYSPATIVSPANSAEAVGLITHFLTWTLDSPLSRGAFIGLVDEFTMRIFSYSDGSIFRMEQIFPNALANGQLTSFFTYPSTYAHAHITETGIIQLIPSDSLDQHIVCQRDTAFQGCYTTDNPANLNPVISGYQSMTLTLCRQVCQGQGITTILISSTECICSDVTHLMTTAASTATECDQACPGSRLQHCGGTNYFRMYIFDVDIADSCQDLYDNFVLLPLAYNIAGSITTCGVDDLSTSCPAGYIAISGKCYRPNPRQDIVGTSARAKTCASQGGYLASPTSESRLANLTSLLNTFTSFKGLDLWMLGYWDIFSTSGYVTAKGHMIPKDSNLISHLKPDSVEKCVALNKTSGSTQTVSCSTPLPFVCEADSVKSTCVLYNKTAEEIETSLRLDSAMTVQQCIAYCKGNSPFHRLALLAGGLCVCESSNETIQYTTSSDVTCDVVCPGNALQLCGSNQLRYYSIYDIDIQYNCDDLLTYGIVHPGSYLTNENDYFSCFKYRDKSSFVLDLQTTAQPEPLAQLELSSLKLNGLNLSYPLSEVTFVLDSLHVIEGIVSTGNFSSVAVQASLNGDLYEAHPENQDLSLTRVSGLMSWLVLPVPVVASKIKLVLTSSSGISQTASFEFIGYDYKNHNFSDHFLGCFNSPVVAQGTPFMADPDFDFCLDQCYTSSNRSVALSSSSIGLPECQCVEILQPRDPYSPITRDRKCNAFCDGGLICSSAGADDMAIYKKLDLTCSLDTSPPLNVSAVLPEGVSIAGSDGMTFPVGTQLTLTCDLGYEFNQTGLVPVSSVCSSLDGWGLSGDDIMCYPIDCGYFPAISGAVISISDSTVYNSTVQYTCADPKEGFNRTEDVWEMTCHHTKEWLPLTDGCELKLCTDSPPTVVVATSNITSVTLPTLGTVIGFKCEDGSRFLSDNSTETSTECQLPGVWSEVETTCTRHQCSSLPPPKENTTSTAGSVDLEAFYQCDQGLTFSDRQTVKTVSCNATTFEWDSVDDECKIYKFFEVHVCLARLDQIVSQAFIGQLSSRGIIDCAQNCMTFPDCVTFSFSARTSFGETNCLLSSDTVSNTTTTALPGWNVHSLNGDC